MSERTKRESSHAYMRNRFVLVSINSIVIFTICHYYSLFRLSLRFAPFVYLFLSFRQKGPILALCVVMMRTMMMVCMPCACMSHYERPKHTHIDSLMMRHTNNVHHDSYESYELISFVPFLIIFTIICRFYLYVISSMQLPLASSKYLLVHA